MTVSNSSGAPQPLLMPRSVSSGMAVRRQANVDVPRVESVKLRGVKILTSVVVMLVFGTACTASPSDGNSDVSGGTSTLPTRESTVLSTIIVRETTTVPERTILPPTTTTSASEGRPVLSVNPRTGSASAESVITVSGTGCPRSARFWIEQDGVEGEGAQFADSGPDGSWAGALNIDDGDSPGRSHRVAAECYERPGVVRFKYEPVPIEVRP